MKNSKENLNKWRENHHKALESLKGENCNLNGLQLWRKLRTIEVIAHAAATDYYNTKIDTAQLDAVKDSVGKEIERLFKRKIPGLMFNSDPRGYALKLDNETVTIPEGMHKDWGGYGILAAIIE